MGLIQQGNLADAATMLRDVLSRAPAVYARETQQGEQLAIRFWSTQEFMGYVALRQHELTTGIVWVPCAYPRAAYYLGFLELQQGRAEEAMAALEFGLKLDPAHPLLHQEKAQVYMRTGRPTQALAEFDAVLSNQDAISRQHWSLALRQKGVTLIDLNRLDEAEACLKRSLELEPGNEIATKELLYIGSLRSGGAKAIAGGLTQTGEQRLACAICGSTELDGAKLGQVSGRPIVVCKQCLARRPVTKKWWQFWK